MPTGLSGAYSAADVPHLTLYQAGPVVPMLLCGTALQLCVSHGLFSVGGKQVSRAAG